MKPSVLRFVWEPAEKNECPSSDHDAKSGGPIIIKWVNHPYWRLALSRAYRGPDAALVSGLLLLPNAS